MTDEMAVAAAERAVWEALVRGDAQADAALLAERFLGVYPDGIAGRADHAAQLAEGPTIGAYAIAEERFLRLGPDHMLIAYHATYTRPGSADRSEMRVSSVWERRQGGWLGVFSQDTPVAPGAAQ